MAHSNAVQLAEHVGAAITAQGATGIITAYKFVGDGSSLTGIDATSIKDSGGTVRAQAYTAGVTITGVATATSFEGDGSALSNLPAGLGTANSASGDGGLFYYTNQVLDIGSNLTLDAPSTAAVIYTQYAEVAVANGVDLTISDGDELVTDILGISTEGTQTLAGTGGRVRTDTVTARDTKSPVNFPSGITGVAATFTGNVTVENSITCTSGGDVQIYHDGAKKFETESWGAQFFDDVKFDNPDTAGRDVSWIPASDVMRWQDDTKASFGDGDDLQIYHDGTHNYIEGTTSADTKIIQNGNFLVQSSAGETILRGLQNAQVDLWYNNTKRIETTDTGVVVTGIATATSLSGRHGNIEAVTKSAQYTLVDGDQGKMIITDSEVIVPQNLFSAGDVFTVCNSSASDINITKGTGINLYTIGSSTNATVTLAEKGIAVITCFASNDFIVGGGGVS